jgi:hypothetical protein
MITRSHTCSGASANRLLLAVWEFELLIWDLRNLHRVENSDLSREAFIKWSIHMPAVRTSVAGINLFLTQRILMEKCMVLNLSALLPSRQGSILTK